MIPFALGLVVGACAGVLLSARVGRAVVEIDPHAAALGIGGPEITNRKD